MSTPARTTTAAATASPAPAASADAASRHHHSSSSGHDKAHVTWDEETIAEHDLLRGTRQKIEEPNTPYHYYNHEADDAGVAKSPVSPARSLSGKEGEPSAIEWNELRDKLETVQQHDAAHASEWDSSSSGDEASAAHSPARFAARDADGKKVAKDPQFAAKRKSHYNEFERVKAWRQAHANDDDNDEE